MALYDREYPAGPGKYPLYPDPRGIYSPMGSKDIVPMGTVQVPVAPTDRPSAQPRVAVSQTRKPWELPIPYTSPGQADQDVAGDVVAGRTSVAAPKPVVYGPEDMGSWLKAGAAGEQRTKDYGFGGPAITATADKRGVFNTFSGFAPTTAAGGVAADIAKAQKRLAYHEGRDSLTSRIFASGLRKQIANLRAQQVQQGQLGVQQRQTAVAENRAFPEIAMNTHELGLILSGDTGAIRRLAAARKGEADLVKLITSMQAGVLDPDRVIAQGGASIGIPGLPAMQYGAPIYPDMTGIGRLSREPGER